MFEEKKIRMKEIKKLSSSISKEHDRDNLYLASESSGVLFLIDHAESNRSTFIRLLFPTPLKVYNFSSTLTFD